MTSSLLAAIHNAVLGADSDALNGGRTDSPTLNGLSLGGSSQAVNAAKIRGRAEGEKAVTQRMTAALEAAGVKGDAGRMSAALDLAVSSPAMAGADVAAFVVANVAASTGTSGRAASYASTRVAGAGLARPGTYGPSKNASIDPGRIYAARRNQSQDLVAAEGPAQSGAGSSSKNAAKDSASIYAARRDQSREG